MYRGKSLQQVKQNGLIIQNLSKELKNDKEIAKQLNKTDSP